MARSSVPLMLAYTALALTVQAVSPSATITAAAHRMDVLASNDNPLGLKDIKTCDGGHGVFTCTAGNCYFDHKGNFGCCKDLVDCTPITSCVPGSDVGKGTDKCDAKDKGCTSCPTKGPVHCMTIRNNAMRQQQITCTDNTKKTSDTSFTYDTRSSTPKSVEASKSGPISTASASNTAGFVWPIFPDSPSPSAAPAPVPVPTTSTSVAPTETAVYGIQYSDSLSSTTKAVIVVSVVAGASTLAIAIFILYKWIKAGRPHLGNRRDIAANANNGILPTRRKATGRMAFFRRSRDLGNSAGTHEGRRFVSGRPRNGDATNPPRPGRDVFTKGPYTIRHDGMESQVEPGWTAAPRDLELAMLRAYPSPTPQSAPQAHSPVSPLTPQSPASEPESPSSPPYTTTPTPVSPIFTGSPLAATARPSSVADLALAVAANEQVEQKERPKSTASPQLQGQNGNQRPPIDLRLKSSALLPTGGPYLSAERALGSGYWEAEREQLAADLAMIKETEEAAEKVEEKEEKTESVESGVDDTKVNGNEKRNNGEE